MSEVICSKQSLVCLLLLRMCSIRSECMDQQICAEAICHLSAQVMQIMVSPLLLAIQNASLDKNVLGVNYNGSVVKILSSLWETLFSMM